MANSIHKYINGIRYHQTPVGNLPGVTSVLGKTKSKYDKYSLANWRSKVGEAIAKEILTNSTSRGTSLHHTIEDYLQDEPLKPVRQEVLTLWQLVRPIVDKVKDSDLKSIEAHCYHPLGFAGTPDLVTRFEGKITVIDWKNSRKPKKRANIQEYLMQVAAYAKAHEATYGNRVEQAVIVCAVCGDDYLQFTDPDLTVNPELQLFKLNPQQLETHWNNFQKRFKAFNDFQANPWFVDTYIDETNLIW